MQQNGANAPFVQEKNMKKAVSIIIALGLFAGGIIAAGQTPQAANPRSLQILWQRLVDKQGQTCDRCGETETAVADAFQMLKRSLEKLDIEVILEKKVIAPAAFSKAPLESNRLWIAGKPIEEWLAATFGKSQCSSSCGDSECRTIVIDKTAYEAIPAELIVKAGLLAAAQIMTAPATKTCCPSPQKDKKVKSSGCSQTERQCSSDCQG
jgi:hypothetical protein